VKNRLAAAIARGLLAYNPRNSSHLAAYRARSLTLGRRVVANGQGGAISGIAVDVDDAGALLVQDDAGSVHAVRSGEVRFADA
jgi:biotin-(acetyl-CoA carboxylase) ligase